MGYKCNKWIKRWLFRKLDCFYKVSGFNIYILFFEILWCIVLVVDKLLFEEELLVIFKYIFFGFFGSYFMVYIVIYV